MHMNLVHTHGKSWLLNDFAVTKVDIKTFDGEDHRGKRESKIAVFTLAEKSCFSKFVQISQTRPIVKTMVTKPQRFPGGWKYRR